MNSKPGIAIILNGISVKKKKFYHQYVPAFERASLAFELFETRSKEDALKLADEGTLKKYDVILAAGGDGTLHQLVNGILKHDTDHSNLPVLGVIPVGSGNDFARAIGVRDADQVVRLITEFNPKWIDVGKVTFSGQKTTECYFINEADIGMGPSVVKRVCSSNQLFGSSFAYYQAIIATFFDFKPFEVTAKSEMWSWNGKIRTLVVANGRYYGHGLCIAPSAKQDDGTFSIFIAGDVSVIDFIRLSRPLKKGKVISHPKVIYNRASAIELTSYEPAIIEADGELIGSLPVKIEALPKTIRFLC